MDGPELIVHTSSEIGEITEKKKVDNITALTSSAAAYSTADRV